MSNKILIHRLFIVLVVPFILIYPRLTLAWNYTGHVVIAQIAYDHLTPSAKKNIDIDSQALYDQLPQNFQKKLNDHYPNASTFAKLAALPDMIRNWKLITISNQFNAPLPSTLLPYTTEKTAKWHYLNIPYPQQNACHFIMPTQNVVWAINNIETSLKAAHDKRTQGLMLAFLAHFVGDAHQPLHTVTQYNPQCVGDQGGNLYCLKYSAKGYCTQNLHQLWDSGLGLFKTKATVPQLAYRIVQAIPASPLKTEINDTDPKDWIQQNDRDAEFIYSTPQNTRPSPNYYRSGQYIVKQHVVLAGYRLAKLLNQMYS